MKTQLGKQTGIALALLATLLATLFAMGVYGVAQAQASPSATRSFDPTTVAPGGTVVVTIAVSGFGELGRVNETIPSEFTFVTASSTSFPTDTGRQFLVSGGTDNFTYTVTAPDTAGDFTFSGRFQPDSGEDWVDMADSMVTVSAVSSNAYLSSLSLSAGTLMPAFAMDTMAYTASVDNSVDSVAVTAKAAHAEATVSGDGKHSLAVGDNTITVTATAEDGTTTKEYTITVTRAAPPLEPTVALSSHEPGAAVQITISAEAAEDILPDQQIEVDLSAFSVPSTIADSGISISSEKFRGTPSNVTVSGKKVTMTVPNVKANGDNQEEPVSGNYSIRIKQSAGVTNSASGGEKTVKWQENAPDGAKKEAKVNIDRVIKLSKTSGTRGTATTATFKGFANGSATVNLNGTKLDEVTIADNTGTYEIDTTPAKFNAGANTITAQDGAGNPQTGKGAVFTINPKVVVDPVESPVSKEVTIKLSDWTSGIKITMVEIGADDISITGVTIVNGKAEFKVKVPAEANRGTQTVKVTGTKDASTTSATASLNVNVLTLSIQPAMVVPGQQITIQGSGFVSGDEIKSVTIGNQTASVDNVTANSAGNIVVAVKVPSLETTAGIGSGMKTVSVTASGVRANGQANSGRVAEGSIEIPKAVITLDPGTSRRGTTVNVSGSGFPSGDLVQVKYDNDGTSVTVAAGSADASGAVSINFTVPSYARIGSKHDVEATSVGVYKGVSVKATHETPGAMVSLSADSVSSGENITVSGMNFPAFATVAEMMIGEVDVRPVPAPATSIDGDFESTVLVPQLELGNQTVSVKVGDTTITTFLRLGTAAVSRAPADLFADLVEAGALDRIFLYDNNTQEWFLYDPDPGFEAANTLESLETGNIIWIQLKEAAEVQGANLLAGWSLITVQ